MRPIVIGRHPSGDIVVNDELVAPRHCEIWETGSPVWFIRDLGSTNGTRVVRGSPGLFSMPGFRPEGRHLLALTRGIKVDVVGMRLLADDVIYVGRTALPRWDRA
jgi:hypothetical protein